MTAMGGSIRVVIADDHAVVRAGLTALLEAQPDVEVVGEAADGDEACRMVDALAPDVVVMDLTMPGVGGIEATKRIRERGPAPRVLVLTMHDDPGFVRAAIDAGASGYLVKRAAGDELTTAVRRVHKGRLYLDVPMGEGGLTEALGTSGRTTSEADAALLKLSGREREVLELLASGHTYQQAADALGISIKSVGTYRTRLADKLGLKTRAEIFRFAMNHGLLDDADAKPSK